MLHPIHQYVILLREIQPEDVVFLDDISGSLKTARSLGMRTIRVILGQIDDAVRELEKITGLKLLEQEPGQDFRC